MLPNEVFLSHSSQDHAFVAQLAQVLSRHAIPVWYSPINIIGSQLWHDEIGAALNRCDWFVIVLSPHSIQSMWVKRELLFALRQNRFEDNIVPLVYQPCDYAQFSWVLPQFQVVDFTRAQEDGYRALLRIWGIGYRQA
ncbi:MAG TPA: toll/interleukin-1 receptor domain-containing protein [Herpetosiphonaceae bacterium]